MKHTFFAALIILGVNTALCQKSTFKEISITTEQNGEWIEMPGMIVTVEFLGVNSYRVNINDETILTAELFKKDDLVEGYKVTKKNSLSPSINGEVWIIMSGEGLLKAALGKVLDMGIIVGATDSENVDSEDIESHYIRYRAMK